MLKFVATQNLESFLHLHLNQHQLKKIQFHHQYAFYNCLELKSVEFIDNSNLIFIDEHAFTCASFEKHKNTTACV